MQERQQSSNSPVHISPMADIIERTASQQRLLQARSQLEAAWYPDCMVCMSDKRSARFNCGHLTCCAACSERIRTCPVCRTPVGTGIFDGLPPLPGRQPTFESAEVALQRLLHTLSGTDEAAKEEASLAVCQRAADDSAATFVRAGVVPPLVALLHSPERNYGRTAAVITVGLLGPAGSADVLAAGAVPALLSLLTNEVAITREWVIDGTSASGGMSEMGADGDAIEYAALALTTLAEVDGTITISCIAECPGGLEAGLQPLERFLRQASGWASDRRLQPLAPSSRSRMRRTAWREAPSSS